MLFMVLIISTVILAAGLLTGPEAAGSAFLLVSIGLGTYVAHGQGGRL